MNMSQKSCTFFIVYLLNKDGQDLDIQYHTVWDVNLNASSQFFNFYLFFLCISYIRSTMQIFLFAEYFHPVILDLMNPGFFSKALARIRFLRARIGFDEKITELSGLI